MTSALEKRLDDNFKHNNHGIRNDEDFEDNKEKLFEKLKELNISSVEICYSGSGDEGYLDEIRVFSTPETLVEIDNCETIWCVSELIDRGPMYRRYTNKPRYELDTEGISTAYTLPVMNAIEEMTYAALEKTNIDWVNNEGGQGEVVFDVEKGVIQCHSGYNETKTTYEDFEF